LANRVDGHSDHVTSDEQKDGSPMGGFICCDNVFISYVIYNRINKRENLLLLIHELINI